jgi:hypothetical protein
MLPELGKAKSPRPPVQVRGRNPKRERGQLFTSASLTLRVSETVLKASLSDSAGLNGVTGTARFVSETENGATKSFFSLRVKGATAGAMLSVSVDGNPVGTFTVDANGHGKLKVTSGLPAINAGSVVTVTDTVTNAVIVTGTLAAVSDSG